MLFAAHVDWVVVGLGNPGEEYVGSRHNVGFAIVDRLAGEARATFRSASFQSHAAWIDIGADRTLLVKPQTYMNRSGRSVAGWLAKVGLPLERLVVIHDDLDLPLGRLRIVKEAGPGGHKGVMSIQETLGSQAFPRIRVGIGRPLQGEEVVDRVLGGFEPEERPVATDMVQRVVAAVRTLVAEGVPAAMNRYNVWAPRADGSRTNRPSDTPEQSEERR